MAPSFFKILRNPSAPHLSLPPDFVSKHMANKIPKGPIIVSASGGHTWTLKIKKIGDDHCFTNGWKNVVKDIPLIYADFLIFHLVDPSVFRMTIFSPNGCEEILPPKVDEDVADETEDDNDVEEDEDEEVDDDAENDEGVIIIKEKENDDDDDEAEEDNDEEEAKENDEDVVIIDGDKNDDTEQDDDEEDEKEEAKENDENVIIIEGDKNDEAEEADDDEEAKENDEDVIIEDEENDGQVNGDDEKNKAEDPLFTSIIITKTRRSMLRFPAKFAGLAKIKAKGTMAIKNLDGKEWPKCFQMEISHGTERFYTTTGWSRFVRGNHLSEGDECVFRFVETEGKLLLAKVTKKEWSVKQPQLLPAVKRKRGRPSKPPQSSDETPVNEVVKRMRGRPRKDSGQDARQPQPLGETPVTEAAKRHGVARKAAT